MERLARSNSAAEVLKVPGRAVFSVMVGFNGWVNGRRAA
jgi:hypothetical protein